MVVSLLVSSTLWVLLALSIVTMGIWVYEQYVGWVRYDPPAIEHPPEDAQIRILTIGDSPDVVQRTVDALPASVTDVHVITEREIAIDDAAVHVVPESFACTAEKKGRALEWGRRNIACEKPYVLYLDEDTQAVDFDGLPDADVVQFGERPFKTDSTLAYWVEIFRMGFQVEMRAFSLFDIPLYAWGGGIAVRRELEDEITWDFESIIEDTSFVWRAAVSRDFEFAYCNDKFKNQAPPSIRALIQQRRRWFAGSVAELRILPRKYYIVAMLRNASWAITTLLPLVVVAQWLPLGGITVPFNLVYVVVSLVVFTLLLSWATVGCLYMGESLRLTGVILLLAPILSMLNAVGACYGLVNPPEDFLVTEKTTEDAAGDSASKIVQEAD